MLLEPWLFCFVWPVFNFNEFIVYFFYFSFAHAVNRFHHKKSRRNLLEDVHWITLVCETRWRACARIFVTNLTGLGHGSAAWKAFKWAGSRGESTQGARERLCLSVLTPWYLLPSQWLPVLAFIYSLPLLQWYGHPHSQYPSDMGIPFSYYLSDLG